MWHMIRGQATVIGRIARDRARFYQRGDSALLVTREQSRKRTLSWWSKRMCTARIISDDVEVVPDNLNAMTLRLDRRNRETLHDGDIVPDQGTS